MGKKKKHHQQRAAPKPSIAEVVERIEHHERLYTSIFDFSLLDSLRRNGPSLGVHWPDWCWCPISAATEVVRRRELDMQMTLGMPAIITALYAWQQGRGVYRFDLELFRALEQTSDTDDIPTDVFFRLPEWGIYLDLEPLVANGAIEIEPFVGCFVHLEYDTSTHSAELRLVFDTGEQLIPLPLHLDMATIKKMLVAISMAANEQWRAMFGGEAPFRLDELMPLVKPVAVILSMLMYLCSSEPDICQPDAPALHPIKRRGPKTTQAVEWQVGYRLSTKLRKARLSASSPDAGKGASPAPHLRRAHWHTFYRGAGSRSDVSKREVVLHWIPPVLVNSDHAPTTTTVKQIKNL